MIKNFYFLKKWILIIFLTIIIIIFLIHFAILGAPNFNFNFNWIINELNKPLLNFDVKKRIFSIWKWKKKKNWYSFNFLLNL